MKTIKNVRLDISWAKEINFVNKNKTCELTRFIKMVLDEAGAKTNNSVSAKI